MLAVFWLNLFRGSWGLVSTMAKWLWKEVKPSTDVTEFEDTFDWHGLGPEGCSRLQRCAEGEVHVGDSFFLTVGPCVAFKHKLLAVRPEGLILGRANPDIWILAKPKHPPQKEFLLIDVQMYGNEMECHLLSGEEIGRFRCGPRMTWEALLDKCKKTAAKNLHHVDTSKFVLTKESQPVRGRNLRKRITEDLVCEYDPVPPLKEMKETIPSEYMEPKPPQKGSNMKRAVKHEPTQKRSSMKAIPLKRPATAVMKSPAVMKRPSKKNIA